MNIVDLILSNPEQANSAIANSLQARVFDYLDNYQLAEEESLDEATNTVTKDKNGKITGWKHEGDWKKSKPTTDKQAMSKVKADTEGARKWSEQLTKESLDAMDQEEFDALVEDFEQLDELSKATLSSYLDKAKQSFKTNAQNMVKPGPEGDAAYNKIWRGTLRKGINRATGRLTKEDLDEEQITEGWKSGEYVGIADANWVGSNIPAHKKSKTHKYFTHEKTGEILRVDNVTGKQTRNNITNKEIKEDLDEESKMSQQQWEDNRAHKATAAAKKDVAARDPETERRRKQMELLFPETKTAGK